VEDDAKDATLSSESVAHFGRTARALSVGVFISGSGDRKDRKHPFNPENATELAKATRSVFIAIKNHHYHGVDLWAFA
jgi:hypothetical protein